MVTGNQFLACPATTAANITPVCTDFRTCYSVREGKWGGKPPKKLRTGAGGPRLGDAGRTKVFVRVRQALGGLSLPSERREPQVQIVLVNHAPIILPRCRGTKWVAGGLVVMAEET